VYELATCEIEVEGVRVVPFPLFRVLDGKDSGDYIQVPLMVYEGV
jgi:hypothetical protein